MLIKTRNKFRKGARFAIVAAIIFAGVFINIMFVAAAPPKATASATLPATTCTSTGLTSRTCDLWATTGTVTMSDGQIVTIWGYADSAAGAAQLPGPTLIVNEGEVVTVNLTNNLSEDTSIYFQGINMMPDLVGAAASGGTTSYTFTATDPGTYLYEAGLLPNAQHQVAMGMYGALIVRPAPVGQAYNRLDTAYDDEALIILSEIDLDFNNSADPATFDLRNYAPEYSLINGDGYNLSTPTIDTAAGNNVLLRYVNAGLENHTMSVLGLDQTLLAIDGNLRPYTRTVVAETIGAGTTLDVMVSVPASAVDGSKFALYDADLLLHNNNDQGYGGMLTFLEVIGTPGGGGDTIGPVANPVGVSPNPTDGTLGLTITATVSDFNTGNSIVVAAEYFTDTVGADGTGIPMSAVDLSFDSATEDVEIFVDPLALDAAGLAAGEHTIYVHALDAAGNWGSFNLATFNLVNEGPVTKGISLTHDPSAGNKDVLLSATGDDTATGNSNIVAAEYFIDTTGADGTGTPMTVNVAAPIASLDDTISSTTLATLSEGIHIVYVHNMDAYGHWGPLETFELKIDHTGPDATATVAPTPNNGLEPINPSQFSLRLDATLSDPEVAIGGSGFGVQSNLYEAEYYIDLTALGTADPNEGEGAPMYPRDGIFNSTGEDAYAFISLITINSLPDGFYDICVRGRDAAGNWGSCAITVLEINRGVPTVNNVTATPNPTGGATLVALSALASGAGFDIDTAEWFTGADPGIGNGTPMSIAPNGPDWDVTDSVDVTGWATGLHTLNVRARNTAGTWSATGSVVLDIDTAASVYGVTITPAADTRAGTAGETISYLLDVTNTGNVADTYDITVSGNTWVTNAAPTPITLAAGATAQVTVDVTVGATGTSDVATITAASPTSLVSASSTLTTTSVQDLLYFSTAGNFVVPGVVGPYDDADIYSWDGFSFARVFDARVAGNPDGINLPGFADVDALVVIDNDTFYMSFNNNGGVNVPGVGIVQDEDIVLLDAGVWSLYFDGNEVGLGDNADEDVDAFEILLDGSILLSAEGNFNPDPDFAADREDEDVIRCIPTGGIPITACTWSDYFDGSDVGLQNGNGEDVNGLAVKDGDVYLTTLGFYNVLGLSGDSDDVFSCDAAATGAGTACAGFTLDFDGDAEGMTNRIDAIDFIRNGNTTPADVYDVILTPATDAQIDLPGATVTYLLDVTNTGNVADTYDITVSGNSWVTSALPTPITLAAGASAQVTVDVTVGAGGTSDVATVTATSQGNPTVSAASTLTTAAVQDRLYFSTIAAFAVPGVAGPYDDADIYSWDGTNFARLFDARVAGNPGGINLPGNADIDGLVVVDTNTFYMSFNRNAGVDVPGIGIVQDEDIVLYDAGVFSLYFDGNEVGLGDSNGEDVDAFEILPDGSLLISAVGTFNPDPDFATNRQDEDVIRCVPTGGIPITACTWSDYFDGSDVGLNNGGAEDVDGIALKDGNLYMSTLGGFTVSGLSGDSFDVFSCDGLASGGVTSCTGFSLYFDGSVDGITNRIDALDLP